MEKAAVLQAVDVPVPVSVPDAHVADVSEDEVEDEDSNDAEFANEKRTKAVA